jgi:IclR family transcriptional regulator, pca regulon regulatory protein
MASLENHTISQPLAKRDWIAGLEKGLGIMEAFGDAHPRMSATQMAALVGMTRTAARRHLLTLAHLGYVATDGKLFWLTPRVLRVGQAFLDSSRLARSAQPYLQSITVATHETAYVSVIDGNDIIYIARNGANRLLNTGYQLGARVPAQTTAAGLVLLALRESPSLDDWLEHTPLLTYTPFSTTNKAQMRTQLLQARQQDWALSEQQLELGYRGVAVPLRDARGALVGALSVTMPMGNEPALDAAQRVVGALRETASLMRNVI